MSEFDFEELDRAVGAALSEPARSVARDTPQRSSTPEPVQSPVARRASSGRFMDVMHPSSDMRNTPPVRTPRQQSVTTPSPVDASTAPISAPSPVPVAPSSVFAANSPSVASEPLVVSDSADVTGAVDPIDFSVGYGNNNPTQPLADQDSSNSFATDPSSNPDPIENILDEIPTADEIEADALPKTEMESLGVDYAEEPARADSPFLPDAVVEKRPLGSTSEVNSLMQEAASFEEAPALPVDLASNPDVIPESPVGVVASEPKSLPKDPLPAKSQVVPNSQPAATNSDAPSSIFDTPATSSPVVKKKKTGLKVVLWIAILALLGASVGAAVYYFVLPLI